MSKNNRVTILTPSYLSGTPHELTGAHTHVKKKEWYKIVLKSFYDSMKPPYPLHTFKDDSSPTSKVELKNFLNSLNANFNFLSGEKTNGYRALIKLIESVKTEYLFFILDDTMMVKTKNFIDPCVEAMDTNEKLVQIKLGSSLIGGGPTNKSNVIMMKDGVAKIKNSPHISYTKNKLSTGDSVWTGSLNSNGFVNEYPLSYYNCFMRTDFVHRIHKVLTNKGLPKGVDFSSYLALINYDRDVSNKIKTNGWPKGLEFINEYETGWLNFASYVYHLGSSGRTLMTAKTHGQTHTTEFT